MKQLSVVALSFAALTLVACGAKPTCQTTGCAAGATCNPTSGMCETNGITGGGTGGGATGGGTGGGTTGGGNAMGGGTGGGTVDAGPVIDPFDDGGTFVPGDICNKAIALNFDGGVLAAADGDLSTATDQYASSCGSSTNSGADLIYSFTLTEAKGVNLAVADTSPGMAQDLTVTLVSSPCPSFGQVDCQGTMVGTATLDVPRLPAGTWYVLVENYSDGVTPGAFTLAVELRDPAAGVANDSCATAQNIPLTNGMGMVSGTTTGALNDNNASPLSCSFASARSPDVYYSFTLTQPQDIRATLTPTMSSMLSPALSLTSTCNGTGAAELACDDTNPSQIIGRRLPAGTYYLTVDGDSSGSAGDFDLSLTVLPPSMPPANDTCANAATLAPNMSQTIDVNTGNRDYTLCTSGSGGDVVYTFTTTMAQKVTVSATSISGSDAIISLRDAPCDMDTNEVACVDNEAAATETLVRPYLPAGTYFVIVQAYGAVQGQFGVSLALDAPVLPPSNDTCVSPATLVPNVSQMVELLSAGNEYSADFSCASYQGGDAVYTFTTTMAQKVTLTATGTTTNTDPVLQLRAAPCATGTELRCADWSSTDTEVLNVNNLPAGTYYVVLGGNGVDTQYGLAMTFAAAVPVTNDTCSTPDVVTFNGGTATRSVDFNDAMADITLTCPSGTGGNADGQDVVYEISIPPNKSLTVEVVADSITSFDPVIALIAPMCSAAPTDCEDSTGSNGTETMVVPNPAGPAKTVFIVVKGYNLTSPGSADITFTLQ